MVGVAVGRKKTKRHRVMGGALNPATGKNAGGVAVDQQAEQHFGVVGGAAAPGVGTGQLAKVQLLYGFENEARQVVFGQPVLQRRGQQLSALAVNGNEAAHAVAMQGWGCAIIPDWPGKPDRLLDLT